MAIIKKHSNIKPASPKVLMALISTKNYLLVLSQDNEIDINTLSFGLTKAFYYLIKPVI